MKVARTVLRGLGGRNAPWPPDQLTRLTPWVVSAILPLVSPGVWWLLVGKAAVQLSSNATQNIAHQKSILALDDLRAGCISNPCQLGQRQVGATGGGDENITEGFQAVA